MIDTALISAPSRANDLIFGRPLLERLLILCKRAGIRRFLIEAPPSSEAETIRALGDYRDDPSVKIVSAAGQGHGEIDPYAVCVRLSGNLVLAQSQLRKLIEQYSQGGNSAIHLRSKDFEQGGSISIGPMSGVGTEPDQNKRAEAALTSDLLPFALNGRPEDREEAELRLAKAVRDESIATDALMARAVDRRLSWRISLWLARWRVAPNLVTLANTAVGFGCAAMFASTSYWMRLLGSILFLASITFDGVDGELARLRMVESKFGGQLDVLTDNLVHLAIFAGLMVGCYRLDHSVSYLYLLGIMAAGFGLCAISVNRALSVAGDAASGWISKVERATGRDFAYILVVLAIIDHLAWFAWTAAIGTYVFAAALWLLTSSRLRRGNRAEASFKIIG